MLYRGNLDYFSDSVGFKPPGPLFPQSYALSICNHISDNKQYIPNLNQKALIHIADTKQPHLIQKSFYISTYKLWQLYL